jgi:heme/copper-type cytochrome/quinol oxidase subunit 2
LRASLVTLFASLLAAVPAAAQVSSVEEASNLEGIGIAESFVFFLMAIVPIIALIIVLYSVARLMGTKDPQKKTDYKKMRNQAILWGWIFVPGIGVVITILAALTGNPVLESMDI